MMDFKNYQRITRMSWWRGTNDNMTFIQAKIYSTSHSNEDKNENMPHKISLLIDHNWTNVPWWCTSDLWENNQQRVIEHIVTDSSTQNFSEWEKQMVKLFFMIPCVGRNVFVKFYWFLVERKIGLKFHHDWGKGSDEWTNLTHSENDEKHSWTFCGYVMRNLKVNLRQGTKSFFWLTVKNQKFLGIMVGYSVFAIG